MPHAHGTPLPHAQCSRSSPPGSSFIAVPPRVHATSEATRGKIMEKKRSPIVVTRNSTLVYTTRPASTSQVSFTLLVPSRFLIQVSCYLPFFIFFSFDDWKVCPPIYPTHPKLGHSTNGKNIHGAKAA
jgi:hypothetical protein